MKIKLLIMAFIGFCFTFLPANSQTPPPVLPSCLDKLNSQLDLSYSLWIMSLGFCNAMNNPPNPVALAECETIVNDAHTTMIETNLSNYNACMGAYPP